MARNWPCNPTCALCDQEPETATHIILHCPFGRDVWHRVSLLSGDVFVQTSADFSLEDSWNNSLAEGEQEIQGGNSHLHCLEHLESKKSQSV